MTSIDEARLKQAIEKIKKQAQYLGDEEIIENAKECLDILNGKSIFANSPHFTLCRNCWCMTKTLDGKCAKCGSEKGAR